MADIARHPVDLEDARDALKYHVEELAYELEQSRKDLLGCNRLCDHAEASVGYLAVLDPPSPEICRALRTAGEAMAALFSGALAEGPTIDVRLGPGPPFRVPARVAESSHHPGNWLRGFYLSVACRENVLVDALCRVPTELLKRSSTETDAFQYQYVEALQAYWRKEADAAERLLAALEAAHPDKLEIADEDYVLSIAIPEMELLYQLMLQDGEAFNTSLTKALHEHKKYWSQKASQRNGDPSAFIAAGPVALASIAHEIGMPIDVESDYLPMRLVKGECHPD